MGYCTTPKNAIQIEHNCQSIVVFTNPYKYGIMLLGTIEWIMLFKLHIFIYGHLCNIDVDFGQPKMIQYV